MKRERGAALESSSAATCQGAALSTRPALVFDLDETLVFSSAFPPKKPCVPVRVGRRRVYIRTRPGLSELLDSVTRDFDLYFFTASERDYANQVIDAIALGTPQDHRFFRDSCCTCAGYPVKDLRLLRRPLTRVLIIDDIEGSAMFQPENLVRIAPWHGGADDDVLASELTPVLTQCAAENNLPAAFRNLVMQNKFRALSASRIEPAKCS
jgi:Dullard-like phosphatase family protein